MCDRTTAVGPCPNTRPARRTPSDVRKRTALLPRRSCRCVNCGDADTEGLFELGEEVRWLPPAVSPAPAPPHAARRTRITAAPIVDRPTTFLCTAKPTRPVRPAPLLRG